MICTMRLTIRDNKRRHYAGLLSGFVMGLWIKIKVIIFPLSEDNKYFIERSTKISFKLIDCNHRNLGFTIHEELRPFFLNDRFLLDCLFQAVRNVILRLFHELNKSSNFIPGFINVLHTFGRPLE